MIHVPLVTEEMPNDAYGQREGFAGLVRADFRRETASRFLKVGK
jgi:hypothetical protein